MKTGVTVIVIIIIMVSMASCGGRSSDSAPKDVIHESVKKICRILGEEKAGNEIEESGKEQSREDDDSKEYLRDENEKQDEEWELEWFEKWLDLDRASSLPKSTQQRNDSIQYLMSQSCHFLVHINLYHAYDRELSDYRNIDTDAWIDYLMSEYGYMKDSINPYIADVVLDKYIRDYGGEDTKYSIRDLYADVDYSQLPDGEFYFLEITGENIRLLVSTTGYSGVYNVSIEGKDGADLHTLDFIRYLYCEDEYYEYLFAKTDRYWMFIDINLKQEEYCFRNVDPGVADNAGTNQTCGILEYYIADQAIDRYIRDYKGSDVAYTVELIDKVWDGVESAYRYTLLVENDEETLQIEYIEDSWFITVKIQND